MSSIVKVQKRHVTLIEMMIVMFLIALITGVIAYNYRGSLEQGKAFKSKMGIEKIETILNLWSAEHPRGQDDVASNWKAIIEKSPLVQNPQSLIKDGWGYDYKVEVDQSGGVHVYSEKLNEYDRAHGSGY